MPEPTAAQREKLHYYSQRRFIACGSPVWQGDEIEFAYRERSVMAGSNFAGLKRTVIIARNGKVRQA